MQKKFFKFAILIGMMALLLLGCSDEPEEAVCESAKVPQVYGGRQGFLVFLDWELYPDEDKILANLTPEEEALLAQSDAPDSIDEGPQKMSFLEKMEFVKECLEMNLPNTAMVRAWLPDDMPLKAYCSGDIGNDGVNDIVVITGMHLFVLREEADGYHVVDDNGHLVSYQDKLEIKDGKLIFQTADFTMDSYVVSYEFASTDSGLELAYMEEDYHYDQTGQGVKVEYHPDKGTAQAYAYSDSEKGGAPKLLYTAELFKKDGEVPAYPLEKTGYLYPKIVEGTKVYEPNAEDYDYHHLPLDELQAEGEWEPWQLAYMEVIDHYISSDEDWYDERIYFSLIYLDEDDIPELVFDLQHFTMAVFTYAPGKECDGVKDVSAVLNFYPYGVAGIMGYEYYPGQNILFYHDKDMAGYEEHIYYCRINDDKELEKIYSVTALHIEVERVWEDIYYYNGEEVSEAVYESYIMDGDCCFIGGSYLAGEMVEKLKDY